MEHTTEGKSVDKLLYSGPQTERNYLGENNLVDFTKLHLALFYSSIVKNV